ncbi:stress-related protein-like [Typha latifolia]|uniref:stress-related protein-like n=1 Tax=Typha latifolia TaxID=4733 RepID=UPI003C2C4109
MAESNPQSEEINQEERGEEKKGLKYLDFVRVAAMQAVVCFASVYSFAKENSGPLRPGVQAVEGAVKSVVGPVYERLRDVPFEILRFVDSKVEDAAEELDRHLPALVKSASAHAYAAAQSTPEVARTVASEVHRSGLSGAAKAAFDRYEPVAQELYAKYEPAAEQYAVAAWRSLNRLPLFPHVAQILVPTAAYWAEKYNRAIAYAAANGYPAVRYVPEIPTDRIAKVFGGGETNGTADKNAAE